MPLGIGVGSGPTVKGHWIYKFKIKEEDEPPAKKEIIKLVKQHREICINPDEERIDGEECNISLGAIQQYLEDKGMEFDEEESDLFL